MQPRKGAATEDDADLGGRGGKAKEEQLKGAALAAHAGKRARKGRKLEAIKAQRVIAA